MQFDFLSSTIGKIDKKAYIGQLLLYLIEQRLKRYRNSYPDFSVSDMLYSLNKIVIFKLVCLF